MLRLSSGFIAAVLRTNPEVKHFLSISLISIVAIVISIREMPQHTLHLSSSETLKGHPAMSTKGATRVGRCVFRQRLCSG